MNKVSTRKNKSILWKGIERRMISRLKDMNRYADFCLARFIVWREVHRRKKQEKHDKKREAALA